MNKIKAGIIGLGRIASLYEKDGKARKYYPYLTHAGTYAKHPGIELICGADVNKHKLVEFRKMWGVRNLYTDYRKMLRENEIDILSICTCPDKHYEIIKSALGFVKAIFCEKPFTRSSNEVRKIIKLKNKKRQKIAINLYREYDKSHKRVKNIIKSGLLGKVQRVNCYYGKGLRNMGTHLLAYLLGIFGIPEKVKVLGKKRFKDIREFTYDVYFEFNKIPVMMQGCDFNKFRLFEMDFICEKGRIQILDEGLSIKTFKTAKNKAETGAYELIERNPLKSSVGSALRGAAEHLIELCKSEKEPLVSPEKYLDLQLLIEKIEKQGERV